jgi:hypothetical protein
MTSSLRILLVGWFVFGCKATSAQDVAVAEFYNATFNHYFITATSAEAQLLRATPSMGWSETGRSFLAYTAPGARAGNPLIPLITENLK